MLKKILKKIIKGFYLLQPRKVIPFEDKGQWEIRDQEFEFNFHINDNFRKSIRFEKENEILLKYFGFSSNQFENKTIIDIGAGSRLRTKFFLGAKIIAIEPLAERFIEEIPWCDLNDSYMLHTTPIEEKIEKLNNLCDFALSINVLDHCYDFQRSVNNIFDYLKPGGLAFLSFDENKYPSDGHPLMLKHHYCNKVLQSTGFEVTKFSRGFDSPFKRERGANGYGDKKVALHYWLLKV